MVPLLLLLSHKQGSSIKRPNTPTTIVNATAAAAISNDKFAYVADDDSGNSSHNGATADRYT